MASDSSPAKTGLLHISILVSAVIFAVLSLFATLDFARLLQYDSLTHLGDLYPRWYGTRELLKHHRSPYGREVSTEIQIAYYGRPLGPNSGHNPQAYAYPVYVSFFLLPVLGIPFPAVRIVFSVILAGTAFGFVLCCLKITSCRLSPHAKVAMLIAGIGSLPMCMALLLQQLTLLVAFLIAASILSLMKGHPLVAGALLACATIKPQIVVIPALWLVFWSLFHGKTGRHFIASFATSLAVLILAGELLLPGWISEFLGAVSAYARYSALYAPLAFKLFGRYGGIVLSAFLLGLVVGTAVLYRKEEVFSPKFSYMCVLVLSTTLIIMPGVGAYVYNHVLLAPALLLVGRVWQQLSKLSKTALIIPVLLPLAEVAAVRLGYHGPWRFEALALFLTLPILVVATVLLQWRTLNQAESWRSAPAAS